MNCDDRGAYVVQIEFAYNNTKVVATHDEGGDACVVELRQGLDALQAGRTKTPTFFYGADQDTSIAEFVGLKVHVSQSAEAVAIPYVEFDAFTNSPCLSSEWTCQSHAGVSVLGTQLLVRGDGNYIRATSTLPSTGPLQVSSSVTKDDTCDDHFFYFSNAAVNSSTAHTSWSWSSTAGVIRVAWNCDSLKIYGPTRSSASVSCGSRETYRIVASIETGKATVVAQPRSGSNCTVTLDQGLDDVAPFSEPLYFYFGADQDDSSDSAVFGSLYVRPSLSDECLAVTTASLIAGMTTPAIPHNNSCDYADDGECDHGTRWCEDGTDCADCETCPGATVPTRPPVSSCHPM